MHWGMLFSCILNSCILHVEDGNFETYLKKIGGLGQKLCLNAIVFMELNLYSALRGSQEDVPDSLDELQYPKILFLY
jgi:hypothetical protein